VAALRINCVMALIRPGWPGPTRCRVGAGPPDAADWPAKLAAQIY